MRQIPRGQGLLNRANQLGVSENETYSSDCILAEPELQRRVLEAERHRRDASLWVIALLSAVASVVSAVAAWTAILTKGT